MGINPVSLEDDGLVTPEVDSCAKRKYRLLTFA